jgi:hypothetical protein
MRRRRRARQNPTFREWGALISTTIVTTAIGVGVTWYITKKLTEREQEEKARRQGGMLPGWETPNFEEVPQGGDWA